MSTVPASSARDEALEMPSHWVYALDESRWEALRALMTDDLECRYADGTHLEQTWFGGADESIRRLQAIADGVVAVQHYLANRLLDISESHAKVAVYGLAFIAPRGIPNKPSRALGWRTCRAIRLGGHGKQKIRAELQEMGSRQRLHP